MTEQAQNEEAQSVDEMAAVVDELHPQPADAAKMLAELDAAEIRWNANRVPEFGKASGDPLLEDPIQGFDLQVDGLSLKPTDVKINFETGEFAFALGVTPGLIARGFAVDVPEQVVITYAPGYDAPELPLWKLTFAPGQAFTLIGFAASGGRSVAAVGFAANFTNCEFMPGPQAA